MKKSRYILGCLAMVLVFSTQANALLYLPEDAARGGMWANVLVNAGAEYKNPDGTFKTGGGWDDAHHLLGPIPDSHRPDAPVHTSIATMNNAAGSWVQLAFEDGDGNTLRVRNDPTNPDGYDAIIWGNGFYSGGGPSVWSEPGSIYLSQDGLDWWKLPQNFSDPYNSSADGASHQTFDHTPGNGDGLVSPGAPWAFDGSGGHTETGLAGGDAFDMSTAYFVGDWTDTGDDNPALVGLEWFQYILLTGEVEQGIGIPSFAGPDADSVYVFSTTAVPVPGAVWLLGSGIIGLLGVRCRRKG